MGIFLFDLDVYRMRIDDSPIRDKRITLYCSISHYRVCIYIYMHVGFRYTFLTVSLAFSTRFHSARRPTTIGRMRVPRTLHTLYSSLYFLIAHTQPAIIISYAHCDMLLYIHRGHIRTHYYTVRCCRRRRAVGVSYTVDSDFSAA